MKRTTVILLCTLACCGVAAQQPSDDATADLYDVPCALDNGWIRSDNVAGLSELKVESLTEAQVGGQYLGGELHNISEARRQRTLDMSTQTYLRLSNVQRPTVLYGAIGYSYTVGYDQNGSVFIDPEGKPFDIVAMDSTAGTKKLEHYHIRGASATEIGPWRLGASLRVASANYAKQRDARHINKRLDLGVAVGATRRLGQRIVIGLSSDYSREVEGIRFGIYGTKDKMYKVLVDYGTLWGLPQEVGPAFGYANTSREQPFYEQRHGSAFELSYEPREGLSFIIELHMHNRMGQFGQETIYSPIFMEHMGYDKGVRLRADIAQVEAHHIVRGESGAHPMQNYQRLFRLETDEAGGQRVNYYGKTQTLDAQRHHLCLSYTWRLGRDTLMPRWSVEAQAMSHAKKYKAMNASQYHRTIVRTNIYRLNVQHLMRLGVNNLNLTGGVVFSEGYGTPSEQGQMSGTEATSTKLVEMTDMLMHDFCYRTADKLTYHVGAEYQKRIRNAQLGFRCRWQQTVACESPNIEGQCRNQIDMGLTLTRCR